MSVDFSVSGYAALLQALRDRRYVAVSFAAVKAQARHVVLRHDIDVRPQYAIAMAEAEAELGFAAHYFFLTTSELYNPASPAVREVFRRLLALGHRIGLHFDASVCGADPDLDGHAARECDLLQQLSGTAIDMVSFHRPVPAFLGNPLDIGGRPHTYQPRYFSDIGYCSDSRGEWRSGDPLQLSAVAEGRALQLLTHPVWWIGAPSAQECLDAFLATRCRELDRVLAQNVTTHKTGRLSLLEEK